jgi:hypothetical protein
VEWQEIVEFEKKESAETLIFRENDSTIHLGKLTETDEIDEVYSLEEVTTVKENHSKHFGGYVEIDQIVG